MFRLVKVLRVFCESGIAFPLRLSVLFIEKYTFVLMIAQKELIFLYENKKAWEDTTEIICILRTKSNKR